MNHFVTEYLPSVVSTNLKYEDCGCAASSLKDIPIGAVWTEADIQQRKEALLERGRDWLVVDNLIVHESIKLGEEEGREYIRNYQETLLNLSAVGIKVVCYNFMPIFGSVT